MVQKPKNVAGGRGWTMVVAGRGCDKGPVWAGWAHGCVASKPLGFAATGPPCQIMGSNLVNVQFDSRSTAHTGIHGPGLSEPSGHFCAHTHAQGPGRASLQTIWVLSTNKSSAGWTYMVEASAKAPQSLEHRLSSSAVNWALASVEGK